jgi:tetratricopeptide (TPR) repeat protein
MKRKGKGVDLSEQRAQELPGHALRVFRVARDKSQEDLSSALGRGLTYVSRLEKGVVERPVFEQAAEALGSPPEAVDWTTDYLERLDGAVGISPAPDKADDDEVLQTHRRIAAEMGRWVEGMVVECFRWAKREMDAGEEAHHVHILLERLRWRPFASRLALVRESAEFHRWRFVLRLCDESLKATADDADRAREWAELAVLAAGLVPGEPRWRARVQGYATVHLANALRVKGDLRAADRAYSEGRRLWDQGGPGPEALNEARLLGFGASLRRAQRRFEEALELLDQALKVDEGDLKPHLLINQANLLREMGNLEGAAAALGTVRPLLEKVDDPRLVLAVELNAVDHLSVLGLFEEAGRRLPKVWQLARDISGELDRLRLVWVQARVAAGTGQEAEGIAALEQVWRDFSQRRMAFDAALAGLELAALRLRKGETGEVKALACQMTPLFEGQEVHREALAGLALFCKAAEQERANVAFVERLVRYLHRARHNPGWGFRANPATDSDAKAAIVPT